MANNANLAALRASISMRTGFVKWIQPNIVARWKMIARHRQGGLMGSARTESVSQPNANPISKLRIIAVIHALKRRTFINRTNQNLSIFANPIPWKTAVHTVINALKKLPDGSKDIAMKRKGNASLKNARKVIPSSKANVLSHLVLRVNISIAMPTSARPTALKTAGFTIMTAPDWSLAGNPDDAKTGRASSMNASSDAKSTITANAKPGMMAEMENAL